MQGPVVWAAQELSKEDQEPVRDAEHKVVPEAGGEVEVSPTEWLRVQDQSLALQQLQAKVPL